MRIGNDDNFDDYVFESMFDDGRSSDFDDDKCNYSRYDQRDFDKLIVRYQNCLKSTSKARRYTFDATHAVWLPLSHIVDVESIHLLKLPS